MRVNWVELPFPSSSRDVRPFDLIHCDLWTSPYMGIFGYKYYLVILDDCYHYSWTFPLHLKSETFPTLSHFFAYVPLHLPSEWQGQAHDSHHQRCHVLPIVLCFPSGPLLG
jgi:hypothetical protein